MRITSLLLALFAAGCSTIGYDRLPGPAAEAPIPDDAPHALLVIVDGLRADVLEDYLRTLRENDQEPAWPSGLALLARDGFRLAQSARAEAALPGYGLAADATLITGQYPDATGIPGSVFYEAGPDGELRRFDFLAPPDAARIYFEPGFALPDAEHRPLLETLLRAPTVYERLAGAGRSVAVLHQIGRGAEWLVPDRSGDGINAVLQHEYSAWTVPLFDRGVRNAAIDVLLAGPAPRLLTLYFRGVSSGSCFQALRTCSVEPPDLPTVQAETLQVVDGHLERVLKVLQGAQPDIFRRTTIIIAGTGGLTARDGARDAARQLTPADVFTRLADASEGACADWLRQAPTHAELVLAPNGAVGQLYVRQGPPGQRAALAERLDCLAGAIQRVLSPADRKASDAWLGGAAWLPGAGLGDPRPRGARVEVGLAPQLANQLVGSRRTRLLARLRRGFDDGPYRRTGDAILYAAAPWTFTDPLAARAPAHAGAGGLEDAAAQTAFLVADARLTDQAVQGLTTASIELTDVVPTLLAVLGAPVEAQAGLPRPPLLAWQDDQLDWVSADRQVPVSAEPAVARWVWRESPTDVTVGIEEPASLWPPDKVGLRVGGQRFDWNPDAGTFPEGAPCSFAEAEGRRSWRCTVPVDRSQPAIIVAAGRRAPAGDEAEGAGERTTDFVVPALLGPAAPPAIERLKLVCAAEEGLTLDLAAQDAAGLDRVEIVLANRQGVGQPDRLPASLQARQALGALQLDPACKATPLDAACTAAASHPRVDGPVRVPFPAALLVHQRQATRVLSVDEGQLEPFLARFGSVEGQEPPRFSFLLARVCNVAGQCTERPFLSDRAYLAAVEAGCP